MCLISATWGGAKLSDALLLVGVSYHTEITVSGGKHVEFVSVDQCPVSILNIFVYQIMAGLLYSV